MMSIFLFSGLLKGRVSTEETRMNRKLISGLTLVLVLAGGSFTGGLAQSDSTTGFLKELGPIDGSTSQTSSPWTRIFAGPSRRSSPGATTQTSSGPTGSPGATTQTSSHRPHGLFEALGPTGSSGSTSQTSSSRWPHRSESGE